MERKLLQIGSFTLIVAIVSMGFSSKNGVDLSHYILDDTSLCYYVPNEEDVMVADRAATFELFLGKSYIGFKEALGFKESSGNYSVINEFGYMGKYQFGKSTLKMIGIYDSKLFLKDASLQEKAFKQNVSRNKWILRKDIERFRGRYINGVKVTESGILAAAHLAGAGNVQKYLRSYGATNFKDAYGTSISHYLRNFSGYDTSQIVANKRARVL